VRFDSSRSWETFKLKGSDGLRQELGLSSVKKMIEGCPQNYNARYCFLKTFNGRLSVVMGGPKGMDLLKHLRQIEGVLKFQSHQKRVGLETTRVVPVEVFIRSTSNVGTMRPLSQPGVGSALRPFGPAQMSSPWLALG